MKLSLPPGRTAKSPSPRSEVAQNSEAPRPQWSHPVGGMDNTFLWPRSPPGLSATVLPASTPSAGRSRNRSIANHGDVGVDTAAAKLSTRINNVPQCPQTSGVRGSRLRTSGESSAPLVLQNCLYGRARSLLKGPNSRRLRRSIASRLIVFIRHGLPSDILRSVGVHSECVFPRLFR